MFPQFPSNSASRGLFHQIKSEDRWRGVYFPAPEMSISDVLVISQIARDRRRFACALIRQSEDIKRIAGLGMVYIRFYHAGHVAWTPAAKACRDGDILFASHAERYGKALHEFPKPSLPKHFPGVYVQGSEITIQIANERQSAAC